MIPENAEEVQKLVVVFSLQRGRVIITATKHQQETESSCFQTPRSIPSQTKSICEGHPGDPDPANDAE